MKSCASPAGYRMTRHALRRAHQRRISIAMIELVLRYGRLTRANCYSLSGIPRPFGIGCRLWGQAAAVVVVVAPEGRIPTVFRRRDARPASYR